MSSTAAQVELANRTADRAIELWQDGEREQAVAMLEASFELNPVAGGDYSWLLGTWQLLLGHPAEQVLAMLRKHASFVPEWYFANAIAIYKIQGNSPVFRAAVSATMSEGTPIYGKLVGITNEALEDGIELEGPHSYPEYGSVLWTETAGALETMQEHFEKSVAPLERIPEGTESDPHYKLWQRHHELGMAQLRRDDGNKAQKELLTALKEIRRFGLFTIEHDLTLSSLIMLRVGGTAPQVKSAILAQLEAMAQMHSADPELLIRKHCEIGRQMLALREDGIAETALESAFALLEKLQAKNPQTLDLELRAEVLRNLADVTPDAQRAKVLLNEALELTRSYLGPNHCLLADVMEQLQDVFEKLGNTAGMESLEAEIERLNSAYVGRSNEDYLDEADE